jgi:hypothetical protein
MREDSEKSEWFALTVEGVWIRPIRPWLQSSIGLYKQCRKPHLFSEARSADKKFAKEVEDHANKEGKQFERFELGRIRY